MNSKICVVNKNNNARLILTKSSCDHDTSPGIGFSGGSPYISIPINDLVKSFESATEFSREALETALRDSLINEYGLCRDLDIEVSGDLIKIRLINLLQEPLKKYINRPIDPYVVLTLISLARAVGSSSIQLISRSYENSDLEIRARVIRNA